MVRRDIVPWIPTEAQLEQHLVKHIYELANESVAGLQIRRIASQVDFGSAGRPDILAVSRLPWETGECLTVVELKVNPATRNDVAQLASYLVWAHDNLVRFTKHFSGEFLPYPWGILLAPSFTEDAILTVKAINGFGDGPVDMDTFSFTAVTSRSTGEKHIFTLALTPENIGRSKMPLPSIVQVLSRSRNEVNKGEIQRVIDECTSLGLHLIPSSVTILKIVLSEPDQDLAYLTVQSNRFSCEWWEPPSAKGRWAKPKKKAFSTYRDWKSEVLPALKDLIKYYKKLYR